MEKRIGTESYFVRFLGVVRDRDIYNWNFPGNRLNASDFTCSPDNPIEAGAAPVGQHVANPPGDTFAWVQEGTLPFTVIKPGNDYNKAIHDSYELLETEVRKQTGAVEIYSREQTDGVVKKALRDLPQNLVQACLEALDKSLRERTDAILNQIKLREKQAIETIDKATKDALKRIEKAKGGAGAPDQE